MKLWPGWGGNNVALEIGSSNAGGLAPRTRRAGQKKTDRLSVIGFFGATTRGGGP